MRKPTKGLDFEAGTFRIRRRNATHSTARFKTLAQMYLKKRVGLLAGIWSEFRLLPMGWNP